MGFRKKIWGVFKAIEAHRMSRVCIRSFFCSLLSFFLLDVMFPLKVDVSYSSTIYDREGNLLQVFLNKEDKWRMKTELHEIMPELKKAILYKEDKYFYWHTGINPLAIARAFITNLSTNKRTSGASTITMQVARLLEPKPRTYWNKICEMFRAMQLEARFSKQEILQLYLNLIPYGKNIEGVKSAAMLYFNRLPGQLSLAQTITLTIIPNRPTSLVPGRDQTLLLSERNRWIKKLQKAGKFKTADIETALQEPMQWSNPAFRMPITAPHFTRRLYEAYPHEANLKTTLLKTLQLKTEQLTHNYIKRLEPLGIHNAAVLVVNNQTHHVEAYVGSANFFDRENAGQVDGITAVRSPGSTLKPFVYALAMDKGILTPKTVLEDIPTDWQGYAPDNFDKEFRGRISMENALASSLNIPAVYTLHQVGVEEFIKNLQKAGFATIESQENKLGLSMILGGCGVTLEEMTNLFTTFAHQGRWHAIQYLPLASKPSEKILFSETSAQAITQILTQARRPDLPKAFERTLNYPSIAWKTGTSYGRRDAWSIGFNRYYTVGVWIGNFSGVGVQELTGAEVATPLLFEIFRALRQPPTESILPVSKNISLRSVCIESGLPPGEHCENLVNDYYIPLVSATQKCEHLKEVYVSEDETRSYEVTCLPREGFKKKLYPNLSASLINYYIQENIPYVAIPPRDETCQLLSHQTTDPVIVSPVAGREYILPENAPPEIMLSAQVHNEVKKVYWYIDDVFYQEAEAGKPIFFAPQTIGKMRISCSDDKGRTSHSNITILYE